GDAAAHLLDDFGQLCVCASTRAGNELRDICEEGFGLGRCRIFDWALTDLRELAAHLRFDAIGKQRSLGDFLESDPGRASGEARRAAIGFDIHCPAIWRIDVCEPHLAEESAADGTGCGACRYPELGIGGLYDRFRARNGLTENIRVIQGRPDFFS